MEPYKPLRFRSSRYIDSSRLSIFHHNFGFTILLSNQFVLITPHNIQMYFWPRSNYTRTFHICLYEWRNILFFVYILLFLLSKHKQHLYHKYNHHMSILIPSGIRAQMKLLEVLIWCSRNFYLDEFIHQKYISDCHPSHEIQLQLVSVPHVVLIKKYI